MLNSLTASLQSDQIDSLIVEGYTDNTGSAAYNEKLSNHRASSVATYLSQKLSLKKQTYEAERSIADNGTIGGRQTGEWNYLFTLGSNFK